MEDLADGRRADRFAVTGRRRDRRHPGGKHDVRMAWPDTLRRSGTDVRERTDDRISEHLRRDQKSRDQDDKQAARHRPSRNWSWPLSCRNPAES